MICNNFDKINEEVGTAKLLVVSKNQPVSSIMELYEHGVREFGENRVAELKEKFSSLPDDISWHFIGRIQTNKLRDIVKYATLIHSVDSIHAFEVINKEAKKLGKIQSVLIQLNISNEESKTGFDVIEAQNIYNTFKDYSNISIEGVMTMAPFTDDVNILEAVFSETQTLAKKLGLSVISMGMSNDYKVALNYGATIIRIGTSIFKQEEV